MGLASRGRVAIVGAGPAGSLLAIALLEAARVRRSRVEVFLFHGGTGERRRQVLLEPAAVSLLASWGIPLPAAGSTALRGIRTVYGAANATAGAAIHAASVGGSTADDLAAYLRAIAVQKGAVLLHRQVASIEVAGSVGYTVRAAGASQRVEGVVLACGAGAPIAVRVPGHQPPPVWRACLADLQIADPERRLGPWATLIYGSDTLPDLQLLSSDEEGQALAIAPAAGPADLAEALLAATAAGTIPPVHLHQARQIFLPAGPCRPGLPAIGDALGGAPHEFRLGRAARQASLLAAAWLDRGPDGLLDVARTEAAQLEIGLARSLRDQRAWRRRDPAVVERAIAREGSRPASRRVVERALAASVRPDEPEPAPSVPGPVRVFWALVVAWIGMLWGALRSAEPGPRSPRGRIFVVEDDEELADGLCTWLGDRGLPCVHFRDGMSAVAAAAQERPAAVVLDVALPWLDGPTICRTLQRRGYVPVYLTTALPLSLARQQARGSGATEVLAKPLDLQGLANRLQGWVPARPEAPPPVLPRGALRHPERAGAARQPR